MNSISNLINRIKIILDRVSLPSFEGITLLHLFQFFKEVFSEGNFAIRSAAVSFHFFVAIFPTLIFLLSLIPYFPIVGIHEKILLMAENMMPTTIYGVFENTVNELFTRKHNTLLSVGFLLSLYYASSGVNTLLTAFSQSYQLKLKNNYLKQQLLSLAIFVVIILISITAAAVSIVSEQIHSYMGSIGSSVLIKFIFGLFHYLLELTMVLTAIGILFHFGNPNSKKFKLLNVGSLFSTLVILMATWGLSIYFSNFNVYNKIYGSIGSLLIALVWINVVSYVLIIGFELYTKTGTLKNQMKNS
tara:strand:+ start:450 stop:1355 length:906 start_codon:yes stop_codon:yes gene_type:complete